MSDFVSVLGQQVSPARWWYESQPRGVNLP